MLSKKSPHLALLEFMREMETKHEAMIKGMLTELLDKKVQEITESVRTAHDQELINQATNSILENIAFKGETPKVGVDFEQPKDGYTPSKGKDYFTQAEIAQIIQMIESRIVLPEPISGKTPKAGVDYPTYSEIETVVRLQVDTLPKYDEEAVITALKTQFPKIELTGKDLVKEINMLPLTPEFQIDARHIKNLPQGGKKAKQSGAGKGAGLGTAAVLTTTGTIDDSNVTFVFAEEPAVLLINGGMYRKTGGSITWTYSAGTVTLSQAVGINGILFGIR